MDSALSGLQAGGVFIYPLVVVGLVAIACTIDRLYVFLRRGRLPRDLVLILGDPHFDWADFRQALDRAVPHSGFVRFFRTIVDNGDHPVWWIETRAADEAAQLERSLDQGLWILETAVTAAPLLGLLGTISGMIGGIQAVRQRRCGRSRQGYRRRRRGADRHRHRHRHRPAGTVGLQLLQPPPRRAA